MQDLFGNDTPVQERKPGRPSKLERWAKQADYRPAERGSSRRCGNCLEFFIKRYSGKYFKCRRLGNSNAPSTDIRAGHVCKFFKPNTDETTKD